MKGNNDAIDKLIAKNLRVVNIERNETNFPIINWSADSQSKENECIMSSDSKIKSKITPNKQEKIGQTDLTNKEKCQNIFKIYNSTCPQSILKQWKRIKRNQSGKEKKENESQEIKNQNQKIHNNIMFPVINPPSTSENKRKTEINQNFSQKVRNNWKKKNQEKNSKSLSKKIQRSEENLENEKFQDFWKSSYYCENQDLFDVYHKQQSIQKNLKGSLPNLLQTNEFADPLKINKTSEEKKEQKKPKIIHHKELIEMPFEGWALPRQFEFTNSENINLRTPQLVSQESETNIDNQSKMKQVVRRTSNSAKKANHQNPKKSEQIIKEEEEAIIVNEISENLGSEKITEEIPKAANKGEINEISKKNQPHKQNASKANAEELKKKTQCKKLFCFNSQDIYIKRALIKNGWIENRNSSSMYFDFKWAQIDNDNDQKNLEGKQFNHYLNNKELTTKLRLMYNLKQNCEQGINIDEFFPRAYDLGNASEVEAFKEDQLKNCLLILIRKHRLLFKSKAPEQQKIAKSKQQEKLQRKEIKKNQINQSFKPQKKLKLNNPQFWASEIQSENFIVYLGFINLILPFLKSMYTCKKKNYLDTHIFDLQNLDLTIQNKLVLFSKFSLSEIKSEEKESIKLPCQGEYWRTPNQNLINLLQKQWKIFKVIQPQTKVDGTENLWIIKPAGNSRGNGVHLVEDWNQAIEEGQKMNARIIQKQIERPLIVKDETMTILYKKKFDMRQWVLVKSLAPLEIQMFSSCQLRICSEDYEVGDIKNFFRHLTNFSLNKTAFHSKNNLEESVCSLETFKDYLIRFKKIDWNAHIKPEIIKIIEITFKSVIDLLEPNPSCFELYGFDILLDEFQKPWLLEVNLSPACAERAEFLTKMVDCMGEELLRIVLNPKLFEENCAWQQDQVYYWEKLSFEFQTNNEVKKKTTKYAEFEIQGEKVSLQKEKNLDRNYVELM